MVIPYGKDQVKHAPKAGRDHVLDSQDRGGARGPLRAAVSPASGCHYGHAVTELRRILLDGYPVAVERSGGTLVAADGRSVAVDEAVHLPPVEPTKIICVHLNYASRVREFGARLPPAPTYFHKPITALNAHGGDVVRPSAAAG